MLQHVSPCATHLWPSSPLTAALLLAGVAALPLAGVPALPLAGVPAGAVSFRALNALRMFGCCDISRSGHRWRMKEAGTL